MDAQGNENHIEARMLGKDRVIRVDMSSRMRQKSNPIKKQEYTLHKDEISDLIEEIQKSTYVVDEEEQLYGARQFTTYDTFESLRDNIQVPLEAKPQELNFQRRFVDEDIESTYIDNTATQSLDWNDQGLWDTYKQETQEMIQIVEEPNWRKQPIYRREAVHKTTSNMHELTIKQDEQHIDYDEVAQVEQGNDEVEFLEEYSGSNQNEEEQFIEKRHDENWLDRHKFTIYTILIILVDVILFVLLHGKSEVFRLSNVKDSILYVCIVVKYAVLIHLLVTLCSIFTDRKGKHKKGLVR